MDILERAWKMVKANRGVAGVDGQTIQSIEEEGVEAFLTQIQQMLQGGRFRPQPVQRTYVPKPDGRERALGIPVVRDRVVQTAVKIVIEPIFEADFQPCSFGFRPKRSAHDANEVIRQTANRGYDWVVDADIETYFDTIDQEKLMGMVAKRISDRRMLKLIRKFLRAGILEDGKVRTATAGTPQGGVLSPLLANIYLNYLDRVWMKRCRQVGVLVRYADDMVILCHDERNAQEALRRLGIVMESLGLKLHAEKTRLVNLRGGLEGFDFLGFHHRKVRSWRYGRYYLQRWPGRKAMKAIREKVRAIVGGRQRLDRSLQEVLDELNPVLRGWGNYFAVGNSSRKLQQIDDFVRERLYLFLSKKHGKSGRGWGIRWRRINFYAEGLYRLTGTVRRHRYSVNTLG
jgi:group II intron reverse transcriptase/maturase